MYEDVSHFRIRYDFGHAIELMQPGSLSPMIKLLKASEIPTFFTFLQCFCVLFIFEKKFWNSESEYVETYASFLCIQMSAGNDVQMKLNRTYSLPLLSPQHEIFFRSHSVIYFILHWYAMSNCRRCIYSTNEKKQNHKEERNEAVIKWFEIETHSILIKIPRQPRGLQCNVCANF